HMHLICDPRLPRQESDVAAFDAQVKAYKEAGAIAFHAAMTGRRYEDFDALDPFKKMFEQCQKTVELAEPVLRKYRVPLGIENHKGWRSAEQAAWLRRLGSEWVGVCLDFGNNMALCEDPMDTLRTLAPHTFFAHIGYGRGGVRGRIPAVRSPHGRGHARPQADGGVLAREESERRVRTGDDHARSAEDPGVHHQVLGDVRRCLQPAARPRSGQGAAAGAEEPSEEAAAADYRAQPGSPVAGRGREQPEVHRVRPAEPRDVTVARTLVSRASRLIGTLASRPVRGVRGSAHRAIVRLASRRAGPSNRRIFTLSLLKVLHRFPAYLAELAECALRRSESHEFLRRHAIRIIGAQEFRHLAEPFDDIRWHRSIDPLLARCRNSCAP